MKKTLFGFALALGVLSVLAAAIAPFQPGGGIILPPGTAISGSGGGLTNVNAGSLTGQVSATLVGDVSSLTNYFPIGSAKALGSATSYSADASTFNLGLGDNYIHWSQAGGFQLNASAPNGFTFWEPATFIGSVTFRGDVINMTNSVSPKPFLSTYDSSGNPLMKIGGDGAIAAPAFTGNGSALTNLNLLHPHSAAYSFGDSITYGVGASDSNHSYVAIMAASLSTSFTNKGVSGAEAADQVDQIYATPVLTNTLSTYFIGANDEDFYTNDATLTDFASIHLVECAYLAIPDALKVFGTNTSAVTYSGSWSGPSAYGIGKQSTTSGDTATFVVNGSSIVIGSIAWKVGGGGQFSVTVDGVAKGTFNNVFLGDITTQYGRQYAPFGIVIQGLANTPHTVVITVTSATNPSNTVYFDWAAGLPYGIMGQQSPSLFVGTVLHQNPEAPYDAQCAKFNTVITDNATLLASLGLNVSVADCSSIVIPTQDIADGLHPNDSGHAKIAAAFTAAIQPMLWPKHRQLATYASPALQWSPASVSLRYRNDPYYVNALTASASGVSVPSTMNIGTLNATNTLTLRGTVPTLNFGPFAYIQAVDNVPLVIAENQAQGIVFVENNNQSLVLDSSGNGTFNQSLTVQTNLTVKGTANIGDIRASTTITAANGFIGNGSGLTNLLYSGLFACQHTPVGVTNSTTPTTVFSCTVPGGAIGSNGTLRVTMCYSGYSTNCSIGLLAGTTNLQTWTLGSAISIANLQRSLRNRNSLRQQVLDWYASSGQLQANGQSANSPVDFPATTSFDTSTNFTLSVVFTPTGSTQTNTLEAVDVEILGRN